MIDMLMSFAIFACLLLSAVAPERALAGEARRGWEAEWEKTLQAARKEGEAVLYATEGREIVFHLPFSSPLPSPIGTRKGKPGVQSGQMACEMDRLRLSVSCGYYDRTLPLLDGRAKAEGIELQFSAKPGITIGSPDADVYELPLPVLIMEREKADTHRGVPVFPRRKFFHQLLLVRRESSIKEFPDLKGKRVGLLRWYQHALGVWLRGYLRDRWGIGPEEMEWFTERPDLSSFRGPGKAEIVVIPRERSLVEMLLEGEIDILLHEDAHRILGRYDRELKRLFPESKQAEAAYFHETSIFPINHALAIRKEVLAERPWVAGRLVRAFEEAKRIALAELERDASLLSSPWVAPLLEEQRELLRRDMYPYGLEPNRRELETMVRYLVEQGLVSRRMAVEEIFASETNPSAAGTG